MEQLLDGGQPHVLVQPAVARHIVLVQQVGVVRHDRGYVGHRIGAEPRAADRIERIGRDILVVDEAAAGGERHVARHRIGGDLGEALRVQVIGIAGDDRIEEVALHQALLPSVQSAGPGDHELRQPVRAEDEVAVGVGRQQRHRVDVAVLQLDAEEMRGAGLQEAPGRQLRVNSARRFGCCRADLASVGIEAGAGQQVAGGVQLAV